MSEQLAAELKKKRRYQCTTCNKAFSRPSALRTHIYTHTGEKPFECTTPGCGRRFAVISNLRRHFKVHRKVVHANRIPASERLRQVQRLIERTAPPGLYPMQYAMPDQHQHQQPYYHHHHQQQQQHHQEQHHQQHKSPSPSIPLSVDGGAAIDHHNFYRHYQYETYGQPLTPAAGNSTPTLTSSSSPSFSYFKSAPKAPFIVMSDVTQQQQQHHHHHRHHVSHHYHEPAAFHWDQQPHSSFGQA